MFWTRLKIQDPALGELTYKHGAWLSAPLPVCAAPVLISVAGDRSGPYASSITTAKTILAAPDSVVQAALAFAKADAATREFTEHQGELVLDGFSFRDSSDVFEVELALSEWPDGMVTVVFRAGVPHEVLLAD